MVSSLSIYAQVLLSNTNNSIRYQFPHSEIVTSKVGDPKASLTIATTPRCRGGRYSFLWLAPLYP